MIDLHALDNIATDYLRFEALCTQCIRNPTFSKPPTDAQIICGLDRIRTLLMNGSVDAACEIAETVCQRPIDDPRVQLNIRIHKLSELLHIVENIPHGRHDEHRDALQRALNYSQQLADFALNAFPEAYTIFKESMMLFAYPERTSTVQAMRQRRQILADELVSLTRVTVGARESNLSFLIRYLLPIYIQFKSPVINPTEQLDPLDELVCELLLCTSTSNDRTTRVTWQTDLPSPTKFSRYGEYKEADVQSLPERVNISRQESIESLNFTNGDVCAALKNELGRILVNRNCFRALVINYCAARGLHVFETAQDAILEGPQSQYPMLSSDQQRVVISESLVSPSSLAMFSVMYKLRKLAEERDFEAFLSFTSGLDVSLVESSPLLNFRIGQCQMLRCIRRGEYKAALKVVQEKLGPLAKKYPEFLPYLAQTTTLLMFAPDLDNPEGTVKRQKRNRATGKSVSCIDRETQYHSESGDDKWRRHMQRKDSTEPDAGSGVKPFEDFIGDVFQLVTENASLEAITAEVYNAYEKNCNEPQLVQLLKRLLSTHDEWQTHNMMTDNMADALGVNRIRGGCDGKAGFARGDATLGSGEEGSGTGSGSEGRGLGPSSGTTGESERNQRWDEQRENTVLTLMEFLSISRAQALAIVRDYPHAQNAQAILELVLSNM